MRLVKRNIFIFIILFICVIQLSKSNGEIGDNGIPVLLINGYGARINGLGDTFVGIGNDVNTMSVNPAGLSIIESKEVSVVYMKYPEDFNFSYSGFGYRLRDDYGVVGINVALFKMGEFIEYNSIGEETGNNLQAGDFQIGISYATKPLKFLKIEKELNGGISIKYINSTLASDTVKLIVFDLGLLYKMDIINLGRKKSNNFGIGMAIQNIGIINNEEVAIPMNYRAGIGYNIYSDRVNDILIGIDVNKQTESETVVSIGIEYEIMKIVTLRAGYKLLGNKFENLSFGIGGGHNISGYNIRMDYANIPLSEIGSVHTFSLGVKF